jgi:hypothetical protein
MPDDGAMPGISINVPAGALIMIPYYKLFVLQNQTLERTVMLSKYN